MNSTNQERNFIETLVPFGGSLPTHWGSGVLLSNDDVTNSGLRRKNAISASVVAAVALRDTLFSFPNFWSSIFAQKFSFSSTIVKSVAIQNHSSGP